ncbi:hypothetical protein LXA43DRAFT_1103126 [Ganoderma leucocontextum]|nr:hypothetical protein LXA43DRAFT_1103126 [Ganoderma leucocontextum]
MKICDGAGKVHLKLGGKDGGGRPPRGREDVRTEIDLTDLRKLLLDAIRPHLIQWDHSLSSHEVTFANGVTTTCELLVGADGANSRVRSLVSPATPVYLGVNGAEISLAPETTKLPALAETIANVGKGAMMAMQDSHLLGAQVNGDGRIRTDASLRVAESWTIPSAPAEAKAVLKTWMRVPGVKLIGDAVHLMSPFTGAGATLTLLDALELGPAPAGLQTSLGLT